MVVTDSGGIQKEAFFNDKHCIIAREETEWIELVENGFAKIVGSDSSKMVAAYNYYKNSKKNFFSYAICLSCLHLNCLRIKFF